ncbi:MAG TPA: sigma-70 family RNA polymerase sigma factor [Flavipsychrobacter sp.]|nr:sigma-70 family RNA polymerase sigma factor [Flavipsychrobacter sp.]
MPLYSEKEIIKGCQDNDRVYQEYLYKHYYSLFLKICARYAKSMEDAEQLLNDGFLRIFNNINGFRQSGSFEGWMKRIVVNTCLDYLKSKQLKNAMQISYAASMPEEGNIEVSTQAVHHLEFKELLGMIQTLPPVSKTVFNLYVFDGFSHKEIGTMLDISESTSSWHLHHARNLLQKKLKSVNAEPKMYEQKRV